MAKVKGEIVIDIEKCKGCELCIEACPQDALEKSRRVNNKGYLYIVKVKDECTGCTNCALVCPEGGITVYRKIEGKKTQVAKLSNIQEDTEIKVG
ncbi:MAG: ferredoxin family protein [Ignavibacteria bacterium]|jgi:2-oxoglutarate ferredoxin oxidoreductase subunit delta